jgi:hypothetical protein
VVGRFGCVKTVLGKSNSNEALKKIKAVRLGVKIIFGHQ